MENSLYISLTYQYTIPYMWQNFGLGFVVSTIEKEKSGSPFTTIPMWQSNSLFFSLFSFFSTEIVRLPSSENFLSSAFRVERKREISV